MRYLFSFAFLLMSQFAAAQQPSDALATAGSRKFGPADLSPQARELWKNQKTVIAENRSRLLSHMVDERVLNLEAKTAGTTVEALISRLRSSVKDPTPQQIAAIYEMNKEKLGGRSLNDARLDIVAFLRSEPEKKALETFLGELRTKHKAAIVKDVNAFGLKPTETVAAIGSETISLADLETENRIELWDTASHIYEEISSDLENVVLNALVEDEANAAGVDSATFIANEVTNKMRDFSDGEREALVSALQKRLFAKYDVKFLIEPPAPLKLNVSADDDPAFGNPNAPVTVIMFSDFQCPACAASHPTLKRVIAEFGDKVRLVVRDFPLEEIHPDAFNAARAAYAAHAQGKFTVYTERMYQNQQALDLRSLLRYAAELGLNVKQFEIDLRSEKSAAEVRKDIADGKGHRINGTPAIFVNGVKVHRLSSDGFRIAIERALR